MKVLFACGGTAGHINPALAVAAYLKEHRPNTEILFAGNPKGMEATLVKKAGFAFTPITIMGIQRKLSWFNIKYNIRSLGYLATAGYRSKRLLRSFQPDVVVGTGGYVSGPIVMEASKMGICTLAQEQNAFPGVTNKILSKHVDRMLLAVEEAKNYLAPDCSYTVVGNPIRESILFTNREEARKALGVGERICVVSFGGSLGAKKLNEAMADFIAWHYKAGKIHHIHATGKLGVDYLPELLQERQVDLTGCPYVDIREYIDNMDLCLAAADLVICRSGAITLSELQAAGKASILIPSPNVAENHQYYNAMELVKADAAVMIEEKDLTGEKLCKTVQQLTQHPDTLKQLGQNAQKMAIIDSNERIYREIIRLTER